MFCTKCGNKLPDNAAFCPKCGNKVNSDIESKAKEVVDKVVEEIDSAVDSVSKEADEIKENVTQGFKESSQKAEEKINEANEKVKNFNFKDLKEKKYVDLGSVIVSFVPFVLILFNFITFGIFEKFVFSVLEDAVFSIGLNYSFFNVFGVIFNILFFIFNAIKWISLILAVAEIVLLIYRAIKNNEADNVNIFQIISCSISFVAIIGFISYKVYWLRWFGLLSLLLGIDFFVTALMKKEEIRGGLDIVGDFNYIKTKSAEAKANKATNTSSNSNNSSTPTEVVTANGEESYFDGTGGELFLKYLLLVLITVFTCGIATPFMLVKVTDWKTSHTVINGKRLTFNGTGGQLWGLWIKWWLLSLVTCGIYSYFAKVDYYKWETKHTAYEGSEIIDGIYPYSIFEGNSFEHLGYSILTSIITTVTCGIAFPWMDCIMNKWRYKNTIINKQKLSFDLTGGKMFGTWLLNGILTVITCGIYSCWAECKMNRLVISHIHVDQSYTYVEKTN